MTSRLIMACGNIIHHLAREPGGTRRGLQEDTASRHEVSQDATSDEQARRHTDNPVLGEDQVPGNRGPDQERHSVRGEEREDRQVLRDDLGTRPKRGPRRGESGPAPLPLLTRSRAVCQHWSSGY